MNRITDITRKEEISSVDDTNDLILSALLLQGLYKDIKKQRDEFEERGQYQEEMKNSPALSMATGQVSSSVATSKVESDEVAPSEDEFDDAYYAEALMSAMAAVSKNLSKTIDSSSERSVLLKNLAEASIKQAEANLKSTLDSIAKTIELQKKAEKTSFWGRITGYVVFAVTMLAAALTACTPGMQGVAAWMVATGVTMLVLQETGKVEVMIEGVTEAVLWVDNNTFDTLSDEAAMYVAMGVYMVMTVGVTMGGPAVLSATTSALVAGGRAVATGAATTLDAASRVVSTTLTNTLNTIINQATKAVKVLVDAAKNATAGLTKSVIDSPLQTLLYLELLLTLTSAGIDTATGVIYVNMAHEQDKMGEIQEEKSVIVATTDAIESQRSHEDAFFGMIHKTISDIINNMKTLLVREWRTVTNAIQG